ncbi:hypothetical protein KQ51_01370 [Candidatus Izimaplasma bacterium HR1]|jgi:translation elongation factor EF-G|uniref:hypothetical protein n=1 Tax=Candidatus Izimoplasma sp. HR1 TaxID=1541959 RepID=UPI0004F8A8C9|nr:hypothetical protein KQ51_01370 [Candidatus Izimaplasma bacterium HR1]
MNKSKIIEDYNKCFDKLGNSFRHQVDEVIIDLKTLLDKGVCKRNIKGYTISQFNLLEYKDISAKNGVYLIFTDYLIVDIPSTQKYSFKYFEKDYFLVYRGEGSNCRNRISSHFHFLKKYDEKVFKSTMQVIVNEDSNFNPNIKKFRIDLENNKIVEVVLKDIFRSYGIPKNLNCSNWIVLFLPLDSSKTGLRKQFELSISDNLCSPPYGNDE